MNFAPLRPRLILPGILTLYFSSSICAALLSDSSASSPAHALASIFVAARRAAPSVVFLPLAEDWFKEGHDELGSALVGLLETLPESVPILIVSTADSPKDLLSPRTLELLTSGAGSGSASEVSVASTGIYNLVGPSIEQRSGFIDGKCAIISPRTNYVGNYS